MQDELTEIEFAVNDMMDDIADDIFKNIQEGFIREGKVDTGFAMRSWNVQRKFLEKKLTTSCPYMYTIEVGREPGTMPPVEPIAKWIERKFHRRGEEANKIAWAIAMNIKKKGMRGTYIVKQAADETKSKYNLVSVNSE